MESKKNVELHGDGLNDCQYQLTSGGLDVTENFHQSLSWAVSIMLTGSRHVEIFLTTLHFCSVDCLWLPTTGPALYLGASIQPLFLTSDITTSLLFCAPEL